MFLARLSSACQARRNREENMRRHEGDQSTKCMQGLEPGGVSVACFSAALDLSTLLFVSVSCVKETVDMMAEPTLATA